MRIFPGAAGIPSCTAAPPARGLGPNAYSTAAIYLAHGTVSNATVKRGSPNLSQLDRACAAAASTGCAIERVGLRQIQSALGMLRVLTQGVRGGAYGADEACSMTQLAGGDGDGA